MAPKRRNSDTNRGATPTPKAKASPKAQTPPKAKAAAPPSSLSSTPVAAATPPPSQMVQSRAATPPPTAVQPTPASTSDVNVHISVGHSVSTNFEERSVVHSVSTNLEQPSDTSLSSAESAASVGYFQRCGVLGPSLLGLEILVFWAWNIISDFTRGGGIQLAPVVPSFALLLLGVGYFSTRKIPLIFMAQCFVASFQVAVAGVMLHLAGLIPPPAALESIPRHPDSWYAHMLTVLDYESTSLGGKTAFCAAFVARLAMVAISTCGALNALK